ncbi:hypothetical protein D1007_27531 [Hordeum vulgare]|nr:hypothetical protein D1007_27531 [Hordeum vulgare]
MTLTAAGDGQDQKRKRSLQGGRSSSTGGNTTPAHSSLPPTIMSSGKRQLELSIFFVATRRNSQGPQPSDIHERDDEEVDEVQDWIEQAMLDDDDDKDCFEDEDDDEFDPTEILCDPAQRQQIVDYR